VTITAKIIADSINGDNRLTTMQLRYPHFIHAQAKSHRRLRISDEEYEFMGEVSVMDDPDLSRNASSSRAIPIERLIQDVLDDTAMPIHWGAHQPGMQADNQIPPDMLASAKLEWLHARDEAVNSARIMSRMGLHKQVVNRILEPFSHINVLVTATEWDNFFALRAHEDAQPEIHALALAMLEAMGNSTPRPLGIGEWHLPYIRDNERAWRIMGLAKVSAARCARVSYLTHDGRETTADDDLALFDRLAGGVPLHASPLEHQATPCHNDDNMVRNLKGWKQFRAIWESVL